MRKIKDKTNLLVIMQSLSRQMFRIYALNDKGKPRLNKRVKLLKQTFAKNPSLKKELKLRNLLQTININKQKTRQRLIQAVMNIIKKIDNSKVKKQLIKQFNVQQKYWVKPNESQSRIGNILNNSKYYGMEFYRQQQSQVRDTIKQKLLKNDSILKQDSSKNVQTMCQDFNKNYKTLPKANKKLIKQFFQGNVIQQKKVLKQIHQIKRDMSSNGKQKLQYIVQNTAKLDKFDKIFLLTSILQEFKNGS